MSALFHFRWFLGAVGPITPRIRSHQIWKTPFEERLNTRAFVVGSLPLWTVFGAVGLITAQIRFRQIWKVLVGKRLDIRAFVVSSLPLWVVFSPPRPRLETEKRHPLFPLVASGGHRKRRRWNGLKGRQLKEKDAFLLPFSDVFHPYFFRPAHRLISPPAGGVKDAKRRVAGGASRSLTPPRAAR